MVLRKQVITKIALGLALIVLAAGVAVVLQDVLASRQPEYALPSLAVYYGGGDGVQGERLPTASVITGGYNWRFLFSRKSGHVTQPETWRGLDGSWVPPGAALELEFTTLPESISLSVHAEAEGSEENADFVALGGNLQAPREVPGTYTYRIEADFGTGRQVEYFFKIRVPQW
ncbi:MAG: hypothetical protein AB7V55_04440 [Oscillospiraceae bacterium]